MSPYLRSQARSAASGPPVAALRPVSNQRIRASQAVFGGAVPASRATSKSTMTAFQPVQAHQDDLIDLESSIETSINTTNMVGKHTLDHPMDTCGQILVNMSKSNEEHTEAATAVEGPVCHEPTTWLSIPNELKDMVIEQYLLEFVSDKSNRPSTKHCGVNDARYLHLYPGQFGTWAKQENHKLGLLLASMDLRESAERIINRLIAERQDDFRKVKEPMSCGRPTCCHYWVDASFEKARLLSLKAFCGGQKAWNAWRKETP